MAITPEQAEEIALLNAAEDEEFADAGFQVPILKVCQALTNEVKAGDAEAGEFLDTLTGESYGTKIDFIVVAAQRGRSASSKDSDYYTAISQDIIPERWGKLLGEEWVGTPFSEHPDAEEEYKKSVNAGQREWGKGPLISTTYNYTGLVVVQSEDPDEEDTLMPGRVSFLRASKRTHTKLQQLRKALLHSKPWWEYVFELETKEETFGKHTAFIPQVRKGRKTTDAEKQEALSLATDVRAGRVSDNEAAADDVGKREDVDAKGGLGL